jgi:hypothetical protein
MFLYFGDRGLKYSADVQCVVLSQPIETKSLTHFSMYTSSICMQEKVFSFSKRAILRRVARTLDCSMTHTGDAEGRGLGGKLEETWADTQIILGPA